MSKEISVSVQIRLSDFRNGRYPAWVTKPNLREWKMILRKGAKVAFYPEMDRATWGWPREDDDHGSDSSFRDERGIRCQSRESSHVNHAIQGKKTLQRGMTFICRSVCDAIVMKNDVSFRLIHASSVLWLLSCIVYKKCTENSEIDRVDPIYSRIFRSCVYADLRANNLPIARMSHLWSMCVKFIHREIDYK